MSVVGLRGLATCYEEAVRGCKRVGADWLGRLQRLPWHVKVVARFCIRCLPPANMSIAPDQSSVKSASVTAELFSGSLGVARFPAGSGLELVYSPFSRTRALLSPMAVQLLQSCNSFASLDEHAERFARAGGLAPEALASVKQQLSELAQGGLMVSKETLIKRCLESAAQEEPERSEPALITSLGIPTRNRPEALARSLASYVQCSKRYRRSLQFRVCDQSDDAEVQAANVKTLAAIAQEHGVVVHYASEREKRGFAGDLAQVSGVSPDIIDFALFNEQRFACAVGANRNALLLSSVGELTVQVDDDTVCLIAPSPSWQEGLSLSSAVDPSEFWFLDGDVPPGRTPLVKRIFLRCMNSCSVARLKTASGPWRRATWISIM